jgi:hypothetical protein
MMQDTADRVKSINAAEFDATTAQANADLLRKYKIKDEAELKPK